MKRLEKLRFDQLGKKELSQVAGGMGYDIGQGEMDGIMDAYFSTPQAVGPSRKHDPGPSVKLDDGVSRKMDCGPSIKRDPGVSSAMLSDPDFCNQFDEEEGIMFYGI